MIVNTGATMASLNNTIIPGKLGTVRVHTEGRNVISWNIIFGEGMCLDTVLLPTCIFGTHVCKILTVVQFG